MCGIAGIYNFVGKNPQREVIDSMITGIQHRGPNDSGIFIEDNIGLGFVRLSVIDLSSAGHQPKLSKDERYVIVFNGEIYNYIELKEDLIKKGVSFETQTDTEVLLNAYIHWGEDCLNHFNGMWAFTIYDRKEKTLFSARDRFGIKPFYYHQSEEQFVFCSEIPPILPFINDGIKPHNQSIFDYLVFNRTDQNENTFFESIKKLQHGHSLSIKNNQVKIKQWYSLRKAVKNSIGFRNSDEFKKTFDEAVRLRLRSDVPIGVCLSGGLDSSSIVSTLIDTLGVTNLNTFSAVYKKGQTGDEREFINEYKSIVTFMHYVNPTAESLKDDLFEFIKTHAEPIPSTSPYAQYKVMQLAKGKVVVTLNGQGADEHLAGYHYFFGFYFKDLLRSWKLFTLINEIYYYLKNHRSLFGIKSFIYFLLPARIRTKARINEKNYLNQNFTKCFSQNNGISENLYSSKTLKDALLDHFEYKLEHLLKWEDRNSMRFSIEARVPFLDYRLVERSLATSGGEKIKNGTTKWILREAMKGILPKKINARKDKIGFSTPQDEWFKEEYWKTFIESILTSKSFKEREIIDVEKAKEHYKKHLKGEISIAKEIWKWVHLELWFREFIDPYKMKS